MDFDIAIDYVTLGLWLTWLLLAMSSARLAISMYYIVKGRANMNELAVALISTLVITTLLWIIFDPLDPVLKSGIATRLLLVLVYVKLLFISPRPNGRISK